MSTLVFVHAHPDDESSQTAGSMARAHDEGHRVVEIICTDGEQGMAHEDLAEGERVSTWRRREAEAAAQALGIDRVAWLGYADSGMTGWDANAHPEAFMNAGLDEAAGRVAAILDEEDADAVIGYDWHGNYGHPDHVMVHTVVVRAVELAKRKPRYLEETMNRDVARAGRDAQIAAGANPEEIMDVDGPADDGNPFGTPEAELHWDVDVTPWLARKRAAMECHASQTSDVGWFLSMPEDQYAAWFGHEYYREPGRPDGMVAGWPFGR